MGVFVVTGAAGALGQAVVARLVERGDRVAAIDVPASIARLEALVERHGAAVKTFTANVARAADWVSVLMAIDQELGAPDGGALVAGGWSGGAPLHAEADDAAWDAMLAGNLATARGSLRALLPGLVARRRGSIVVIGSRAVERPWTSANASAYAASKSAVVALAQAVAAEVLDHGVRVNAVLPSVIDTPANRGSMPDADFARWVPTSSLAGVIAFLLSDDARDVSGAALPVYGRS
jgi:NAD(P)-dependent dehydrogenase (short-subunit alcohol dehydrogenase family)